MRELIELVIQKKASDLHISVGSSPILRIDGKLVPTEYETLTPQDTKALIYSILTLEQKKILEQKLELDCSYGIEGVGRFRVNVYKDRQGFAAALRTITTKIPTFEQLNLPKVCQQVCTKPRGLVLVTGPTGSGKSTTLAAMVGWINENRSDHILTIEDPIEYIHSSKRSLVNQRELGADTHSFDNALRAALREDPDVILIGEMRDLETIALALKAAETGHLVFGTLHTSSAAQTIDRVVDVFPPEQQQQIRIQLSNGLVAVFSQTLIPKLNSQGQIDGRVMAMEILVNTPAIANLIREGKTAQIYSSIQTGGRLGMVTLENGLADLVKKKLIRPEDALAKSSRAEDLEKLIASELSGAGISQSL
ncbi:MAG: type IV pilus twitching motility protein PilT [Candidatus Melainabacteria bacterium]|nr:type IV pilus twitching motility protein PilT [Candidatus Melainabacteria bacterium]